MVLLHLGDIHFGKSLCGFDLIDDQRYILDQILNMIEDKKVDAVLIAGDVYDRAIPSEAATNLLNDFLNQLVKRSVTVFMISGNHDSDERLNFGSELFRTNNIYISSVFRGSMFSQTLRDEYGEVCIWLLPFVKASQVKRYYPDSKIESYDDAVRTIIENEQIDNDKRNVIIAHQFVAGKHADPVTAGSESVAVQNVGLVEKISCSCFDPFDYVALGHIHSAQSVGRDTVRYSGSPLKYSLSEINNEKSVPVITLKEKGDVGIELVPLKPKRDVRHIKGKMNILLDKVNVVDTDDYMYVTLTDEDVIEDVMGIFRKTYPNTVKIDYDNSHTREMEKIDITEISGNKTYEEIVSEFYNYVFGTDITEEEMSVMKEAAKEAGIIDETN